MHVENYVKIKFCLQKEALLLVTVLANNERLTNNAPRLSPQCFRGHHRRRLLQQADEPVDILVNESIIILMPTLLPSLKEASDLPILNTHEPSIYSRTSKMLPFSDRLVECPVVRRFLVRMLRNFLVPLVFPPNTVPLTRTAEILSFFFLPFCWPIIRRHNL